MTSHSENSGRSARTDGRRKDVTPNNTHRSLRLVIIGAGFGVLIAVRRLSKLPVRITLVEGGRVVADGLGSFCAGIVSTFLAQDSRFCELSSRRIRLLASSWGQMYEQA
jgi:glycine/D-amino acid oxidase-like deaminating enzyme